MTPLSAAEKREILDHHPRVYDALDSCWCGGDHDKSTPYPCTTTRLLDYLDAMEARVAAALAVRQEEPNVATSSRDFGRGFMHAIRLVEAALLPVDSPSHGGTG